MDRLKRLVYEHAAIRAEIAGKRARLEEIEQEIEAVLKERGLNDWTDGMMRVRFTTKLNVLSKEQLAQIAPSAVQQVVDYKVDMRQLRTLWNSTLRDELQNVVSEEQTITVDEENRKTARAIAVERNHDLSGI